MLLFISSLQYYIVQPSADLIENVAHTVKVVNVCTNAMMEVMNNSNMTFSIPGPHMWTNITVIVKNQCKSAMKAVEFNSTCESPMTVENNCTLLLCLLTQWNVLH